MESTEIRDERIYVLRVNNLRRDLTQEEQKELAELEAEGAVIVPKMQGSPPPPPKPYWPGSPYVLPYAPEGVESHKYITTLTERSKKQCEMLLEYFVERSDKAYLEVYPRRRRRGPHRGWLSNVTAQLTKLIDLHVTAHYYDGENTYELPRKKGKPARVKGLGRVYASIVNPKTQSLRILMIDIDGPNHPHGFADPVSVLRTITEYLDGKDVPNYTVSSKSGYGFHIFIFCEPGTPCALGCRALKAIVSDLALSDAEKKRLERFPQKEQVGDGGQPTVSLPWFALSRMGCEVFVKFEGGQLVEYNPDSFDRISNDLLESLVASLPQDNTIRATEANEDALRDQRHKTWDDFKEGVCSVLTINDLRGIYSLPEDAEEPLQGEVGWIPCRDPRSPSGDRNPSAGVAFNNPEYPNGLFHSFCADSHGHAATLSIFDYLMESQDHPEITSFMDAARFLSDLTGVPLPERELRKSVKPQVVVNRQFADQVASAWDALLGSQIPLYVYGGRLCFLDPEDHDHLMRGVNLDRMRLLCSQSADFVISRKDGSSPTNPPKDLLSTMLEVPSEKAPRVQSVQHAPVYSPQWHLLTTQGYNSEEKVYLDLGVLQGVDVPERPTTHDVKRALQMFFGPDGIYCDFPLSGDASRANLMAMHITPFIRPVLGSLAPCFAVNAPRPSSGKTLLVSTWANIVEGRAAAHVPYTENDDELEKRVASVAKRGGQTIVLDNLPRKIVSSPKLADFLTAERLQFRMLGTNNILDFENNLTWVLTANNPLLSDEIARRCVSIRLEPKDSMKLHASEFRHPDITRSVLSLRRELVQSLLTLIKHWLAQDRPQWSGRPLPSFERWSEVCGGILETCDIPSFMDNRDDLSAVTESDDYEWDRFYYFLWAKYGGSGITETEPVTAKTLIEQVLLPEQGILPSVFDEREITEKGLTASAKKLTWTLTRQEGSVHNGLQLKVLRLEGTSEINKYGARNMYVLRAVPNLQIEPLQWTRSGPLGVVCGVLKIPTAPSIGGDCN